MNGFLDTEGKLHKCEAWEHLDYATELVENMGVSINNRLEAEEYLQKLGWVVVRDSDVYGLIGYYKKDSNDIRHHLTDKQKDWLNRAYEEMTLSCRESVDDMFEMDK